MCILRRAAFLDVLTLDFSFMGRKKPYTRFFARPAALPCTMFVVDLWTNPSRTRKRSSKSVLWLRLLSMRNTWPCSCKQKPPKYLRARKALITCKLGSLWSTTRYIIGKHYNQWSILRKLTELFWVHARLQTAVIEPPKSKWVLKECRYQFIVNDAAPR